jgi:hypothetical protein
MPQRRRSKEELAFLRAELALLHEDILRLHEAVRRLHEAVHGDAEAGQQQSDAVSCYRAELEHLQRLIAAL